MGKVRCITKSQVNYTYTESVHEQQERNDPSQECERVCPGYQLGAPKRKDTS